MYVYVSELSLSAMMMENEVGERLGRAAHIYPNARTTIGKKKTHTQISNQMQQCIKCLIKYNYYTMGIYTSVLLHLGPLRLPYGHWRPNNIAA